ncbi:MAG TPA: hypothetical protein VIF57_00790 [Polyangia bacterium]|jgi:hypothetical protein
MPLRRSVFVLLASLLGAAAAGAAAPDGAPALEASYVGTHRLRVNRIPGRDWAGTVTISRQGGALHLEGGLRRGEHHLELSGTVAVESPRKFQLDGELRGVPDMAWAGEAPRERITTGRFTFEATGRRRFWRLYQVDGRECVCNDDCGNDFCYIDIEFRR